MMNSWQIPPPGSTGAWTWLFLPGAISCRLESSVQIMLKHLKGTATVGFDHAAVTAGFLLHKIRLGNPAAGGGKRGARQKMDRPRNRNGIKNHCWTERMGQARAVPIRSAACGAFSFEADWRWIGKIVWDSSLTLLPSWLKYWFGFANNLPKK